MFDFRNGMLGVVIITLAIAGSLFGSYLAGIETEQVEVTKYDYLADVSGLFEYDQSPQYIEFDPSTNYTGYYSEDSYSSFDNSYYFAIDQVDFQPSTAVNNYKITPKPILDDEADLDLSTASVEKVNAGIRYIYDIQGDNVIWFGFSTASDKGASTLKAVIESLNISTDDWSHVLITLGDDVNWNDTPSHGLFFDTLNLDTFLIVPKSSNFIYLVSPDTNMMDLEVENTSITKPYRSFKVNLTTWDVECYYSSDYSGSFNNLRADALVVCYGNTNEGEGSAYDHLNLSDTFTYTPMKQQNKLYLNPNEGVWLKDEE